MRRVEIACSAPDREVLLYDWLNAVVKAMANEGLVFGRFKVSLSENSLAAEAFGEPVDLARHDAKVEVKGATFTELQVRRSETGGWIAQCVVDV